VDTLLECRFLERVRTAVERAGMWESLGTDRVCLDCELMPWSAKAQELLRQQYAPTGAAARAASPVIVAALGQAPQIPEIAALLESYRQRGEAANHLRTRIHASAELEQAEEQRLGREAVASSSRIRAGDRRFGTFRSQGAPAPCSRVCVWSPRPGKRTRRSKTLVSPSPQGDLA
jgi:hypothetical protein